jgi:hypothetical protein
MSLKRKESVWEKLEVGLMQRIMGLVGEHKPTGITISFIWGIDQGKPVFGLPKPSEVEYEIFFACDR